MLRAIALAVLLAAPTAAQTQWTFRMAGPRRTELALAYDAARQRTVLFGGGAPYSAQFPHWEYDGTTWTSRNLGVTPPWSLGHAMAYDAVRQEVVLFGGWFSSQVLDDTWTWDGTAWQKRSPATKPPARFGFRMLFDSNRGVVVMLGGSLNDLWHWDGANWTQIPMGSSPPSRTSFSAAYDAGRDRIVVFGGLNYPSCRNDTWEWDGASWQERFPVNRPSVRWGAPMEYDDARKRIVLYGGRCGGSNAFLDTWEWDGNDWLQRNAGNGSTLLEPAMVYDSERRVMVVHGGWACGGPECYEGGATSEYGPRRPAVYQSFGAGCAGASGTPTLRPAPGSLPWVGVDLDLDLTQVAPSSAAATIGIVGSSSQSWGALSLPIDLAVLGSPGCQLYTGAEIAVPLVSAGGTAAWTIPIPNIAELAGRSFYVQGLEVGAAIAVSDAGGVTMGLR